MKKIMVLSVSVLFLMLAFTNLAVADIKKPAEKIFDVEVTDYNPDGSIVKRTVKMSFDRITELRKDIINARDMEERNHILKDYGLVSKDLDLNDLKKGMFEKAENMGLSSDDVSKRAKFRLPILLSFFDKVDVIYFGGVSARIGTTPFVNLISRLIKIRLPGVDLVDIVGGLFGVVSARGLLVEDTLISAFGIAGLVGFVGTSIKLPFTMHIFNGFSAMTFGTGLGIHIKTFRWNPAPDPDS